MLAATLFFVGATLGSFINVLVIRHGSRALSGRSMCLSCGEAIRWYDNIPILSWVFLRGRCRKCGSRVSTQYPLVEVVSAVMFSLILTPIISSLAPVGYIEVTRILMCAALIVLLIAIAVYDMRHTIIPDSWVYGAAGIALALALFTHESVLVYRILAGPIAALPLFALWLVSRGAWMGLGDSKLALAIGWFLGPVFGIFAVFFAFVVGALVSIFVLLPLPSIVSYLQKRGIARLSAQAAHFTMRSEVAFGPFLIASFFLVWIALLYEIPLPLW